MSWSSNGSVDVYYTSGGSGTIYDPMAMASEQLYYAWEKDFNMQLQKHMRYYTQFYDEEPEYYAMGNTDFGTDKENKYFELWVDRFISLLMSHSTYYGVGSGLSTITDILGVLPDVNSILLSRNGREIWLKGYSHFLDGCDWNSNLAKFHMALGDWMQNFATGRLNRYTADYFNNINSQLQIAREEYYIYLYSVSNPQYVPGVDFEAEDLDYATYNFCDPLF